MEINAQAHVQKNVGTELVSALKVHVFPVRMDFMEENV